MTERTPLETRPTSGDTPTELQGQVERITYANAENAYCVLRLRVGGRADLVTAVGNIANPSSGEVLRLQGQWQQHPRFGEQFQFESFQILTPATLEGISKYLGSGLIYGIGPAMADRIVKKFQEKTLDILENEPARLLEVEGIGEGRLEKIRASWEEQRDIRALMLFLQSHGVSAALAARIYRHYGKGSLDVLRENPYRLAEDVFGVGFLSADRIASQLGFESASPLRIQAGIQHAMSQFTHEGHVYATRDELVRKATQLLEADAEAVHEGITALAESGELQVEDERVYLPVYHYCERQIADMLARIATRHEAPSRFVAGDVSATARRLLGFHLAEKQEEALRLAVDSKILILTGGPGTGKTTLIRAILALWEELEEAHVLLAAPTGRAAKRMAEATRHEAKTIHRMLEYNAHRGGFVRNAETPLECDLLIVDEASMIDTTLMYHLLCAVPSDCRLIFVGDIHQLPSVGPGNVLKDVIDSNAVPVVTLNEIFRQAQTSQIVVNAHRINEGLLPQEAADEETSDLTQAPLKDFYIIHQENPDLVLKTILALVTERIPARFGLDPLEDIQVLTPMHRGSVGASNLNVQLQKSLIAADAKGISRGGRQFLIGDKVMQVRNNYDRDVYNGDIGRIVGIDPENQMLYAAIDGREIAYEFADIDELTHAYAISVHKSQGAEYPAVVMPVLTQHYLLLQRNLLYTAITRGRKLVILVGTEKALSIATQNDRPQFRNSSLRERICERWVLL